MADQSQKKAARKAYTKTVNDSKLGSGTRFKVLEKSIKASGAKDPAAVAASVGRKKYGSEKMALLAKRGKKSKLSFKKRYP